MMDDADALAVTRFAPATQDQVEGLRSEVGRLTRELATLRAATDLENFAAMLRRAGIGWDEQHGFGKQPDVDLVILGDVALIFDSAGKLVGREHRY